MHGVSVPISRLVPMLGSDHDGEVLATVRAIDRKLKAVGLDFHWMADRLAGSEKLISVRVDPAPDERYTAPDRTPAPPPRATFAWDRLRRSQQMAAVVLLLGQSWISDSERSLLKKIRRLLNGETSFCLEPQQQRRLAKLLRKAVRHGL